MLDSESEISINRQSQLLGCSRSGFYYHGKEPHDYWTEFEELVRARIDYLHVKCSYMGSEKLARKISIESGIKLSRKLIRRLMEEMGIRTVYPKQNTSKKHPENAIYPYLLRGKGIFLPNQVWAVDISYIKMGRSHMYLTAIIDWYSRYIIGWELSDTLETAPILEAVKKAMNEYGVPGIINSDQGSQFTSHEYTSLLKKAQVRQSMDGKARWVDNVIIERWFRSLKTENIYINEYNSPKELREGIRAYIHEYNHERPHQSLWYKYPVEIYREAFALRQLRKGYGI